MPLINKKVLMSDANNFSNTQAINPYYKNQLIDIDKAKVEHDLIKQLLTKAGIDIINVESPSGCQDGVYTANWALVRGKKAIMARLPNARQCEEDYAAKVLTKLGKKVIFQKAGVKFSGQGDALSCGNYLFCGSGYRSDQKAQLFAADQLNYECVQLKTVPILDDNNQTVINKFSGWPDSYYYDIDLALAIIKPPLDNQNGIIAYCPQAFTSDSLEKIESITNLDKITVSVSEARSGFATNLISTGEIVIMGSHAPSLKQKLEEVGMSVFSPEVTELSKGGGFIRCMALTLD